MKRKEKMKRMTGNWHPSFSVTEICFSDEETAFENHGLISERVHIGDLYNEKDYDYILQNGKRLIYVSCNAKVFEQYSLGYKTHLEEMIRNNN